MSERKDFYRDDEFYDEMEEDIKMQPVEWCLTYEEKKNIPTIMELEEQFKLTYVKK